jgi:hypothetical protein
VSVSESACREILGKNWPWSLPEMEKIRAIATETRFPPFVTCKPNLSGELGTDLGVLFTNATWGGETPGAKVQGVKCDAEEIGRNKAELRGADTDDANDSAVDSGNHPALP